MPRCNNYKLRVLQEAALGDYNGSSDGYNIGSFKNGSDYNIGGYIIIVCSTLHKQLYWEFGVCHNCVCIIYEGPFMYVVTCLKTFCNFNRLLYFNIKILF